MKGWCIVFTWQLLLPGLPIQLHVNDCRLALLHRPVCLQVQLHFICLSQAQAVHRVIPAQQTHCLQT